MYIYSDIDLKVTPSGDISIGANKDLELAYPSGVLKQDITFRIRTEFNDFTPHPDIGAALEEIIGEPNNRETCSRGEFKIRHSLTSDARIRPNDLIVKGVPISMNNIVYYLFVKDGATVTNVTPNLALDLNTGITAY